MNIFRREGWDRESLRNGGSGLNYQERRNNVNKRELRVWWDDPMPRALMPRRFFNLRILRALAAMLVFLPAASWADLGASENGSERRSLGQGLLAHRGVSFLDFHISRNRDEATAKHNIVQTAQGRAAKRSYYGTGPGGSVYLDVKMLRALMILANEGYTFRITELAGGSHSSRSRHYVGTAFDIDTLNGERIRYGNRSYRRFMNRCRELGATEVLGPGTRGHSSHLHVAWPRK